MIFGCSRQRVSDEQSLDTPCDEGPAARLIRGRALATSMITADSRMPAGRKGPHGSECLRRRGRAAVDRTGSSGRDIPDNQASSRTHGFGDKVARFPEQRLLMVTAAGRDRCARSAVMRASLGLLGIREPRAEQGDLCGHAHGRHGCPMPVVPKRGRLASGRFTKRGGAGRLSWAHRPARLGYWRPPAGGGCQPFPARWIFGGEDVSVGRSQVAGFSLPRLPISRDGDDDLAARVALLHGAQALDHLGQGVRTPDIAKVVGGLNVLDLATCQVRSRPCR